MIKHINFKYIILAIKNIVHQNFSLVDISCVENIWERPINLKTRISMG